MLSKSESRTACKRLECVRKFPIIPAFRREETMPISPTNVCPVCATELKPGVSPCPHCDADLRLLTPEGDIAVDFYNQGLDCVETGDRRGALEKMQAAIAADPAMVDAYIVVGKLLAQTGRASETEQAIEYWKEAKHFTPNAEQSQTIEACLNRAETLLARERQSEGDKKRNLIGASVLGAVALAAVCGVVGFLLHRPAVSDKKNTPCSPSSVLSLGRCSGSSTIRSSSTNRSPRGSLPDTAKNIGALLAR